jgi:ABC-type polysaccharide/polyol phosphate export permease
MLALVLFTLGMTLFFAAVNVFYRDVSHILQIVLSAWFYFTPIIYALDFVPAHLQWLFRLNPLIYVINGFRLAIYYGMLPRWQSIAASFVCGFVALIIGYAIFRKYQDEFVFYV